MTRKIILASVGFALFAAFLLVGPSVAPAGNAKVDICHFPPGNPDNFHTITISEKALPAHLAHGDLLGSCNALCDGICDDGNACTVDHLDDCEANGCLPAPRPEVDCDDGNGCTIDICDPGIGCTYPPKDCSDGDLCTIDACNPANGECLYAPKCAPDEECDPNTGECEPVGGCAGAACNDSGPPGLVLNEQNWAGTGNFAGAVEACVEEARCQDCEATESELFSRCVGVIVPSSPVCGPCIMSGNSCDATSGCAWRIEISLGQIPCSVEIQACEL